MCWGFFELFLRPMSFCSYLRFETASNPRSEPADSSPFPGIGNASEQTVEGQQSFANLFKVSSHASLLRLHEGILRMYMKNN
ncbi:hypothetical protein NC651_038646 [Populus alba x Populus x berolinensis]|nr:hypothetical protein NC651_038646 [Populus alba x Populus x berolinensis]